MAQKIRNATLAIFALTMNIFSANGANIGTRTEPKNTTKPTNKENQATETIVIEIDKLEIQNKTGEKTFTSF
jgi:hypothetical protein